VDVVTAIAFRSVLTAFVIALIVWQQRVPLMLTRQQQRHLPVIGLLIAVQSFCLYSAVARLPVVLALLAFNTYPISTALWARLLYKQRPQREVLLVIPFILLGLALALDVLGAASGLSASAHWLDIGSGVAFAFAASLTFGLCLVITENETRGLDGRLRTLSTLGIVGLLAVAAALSGDGFQLPNASPGWWGLMLLTFLYGTAFTVMFTVLPKLGVVGNSAIMNVEPVFALLLAWALLGQTIAPMQVGGASLVVVSVMWLGLRKG
jgi:drug/metabolite transporter (DMT)-like permease